MISPPEQRMAALAHTEDEERVLLCAEEAAPGGRTANFDLRMDYLVDVLFEQYIAGRL